MCVKHSVRCGVCTHEYERRHRGLRCGLHCHRFSHEQDGGYMAYSYWYYTRRHSWGATLWRTYMLLCGSPGPISLSTIRPYHYTALSLFHSLPLATATLLCLPCCYSCGHRMGRYSTRLSVGGRLGRCLWWVSSCFAASRSNQRVWTMGCLKHGTSATVGSS